jgi:hypothetical protein
MTIVVHVHDRHIRVVLVKGHYLFMVVDLLVPVGQRDAKQQQQPQIYDWHLFSYFTLLNV